MCGIAGFIGFKDEDLIKKCSQWLAHRGPDGDGYYIDNDVSLLNRRLAIIDIKGGNQPIYNEDGTMVIVYNGEIYNYQELRKQLEKKGHIFKTVSDTEVILHGYEEWGNASFDRLNGMFAIAIHDKKEKKTILARDHFGIKPLYFSLIGSTEANSSFRVMFSSEIKPLIYSGLIPVEPSDSIIYRYLKFRIHDDGRDTFFKGVMRLLPGEMMEIKKGKNKITKYTDIEEQLKTLSNKENSGQLTDKEIELFRSLLIDSVRRRLVSEVPVGTCLSGGLDSSTVVSIVNTLLHEKVKETQSIGDIQKTFSAVFPGSSNDEEKYIDALLSTSKDIKDYKVYPQADGFFDDLKDFVKTQEEPTISTGPYAQYKVMQKAHEYVTVVLDGQGADEMMAGYVPYYFVYLRQLWKTRKYTVFIKEIFAARDVIVRFLLKSKKQEVLMMDLLNKEFSDTYKKETFTTENKNIKKRLIEDIFKNSLQSLLRYEDKNAMKFSIEGRVPFLDFRLLRLLFSLPNDAIISGGWNKFILRRSTEKLLPELINKRRNKIGFTTPEYEWFKKKSNEILSIFTGERFEAKKYVNQAQVVLAFNKFIVGKADDTMLFWRILNLELWMREFIKPVNELTSFRVKELAKTKEIKRDIVVNGKKYARYPIRTDVFKKGDDAAKKISEEINKFIQCHPELVSGSQDRSRNKFGMTIQKNKKWFIVISEKIVATAQGRAYFIWDIKPSFFATILSRYVSRVPWGIGLGSPWTMQLAINEVGLPRIFFASVIGGVGKLVGKKGLFYQIAGRSTAGIDGPTEYSLYPANVSAKLLPRDPQKVCEGIHDKVKDSNLEIKHNLFGVVIIDANDIGRNVLGNSTQLSNKLIEEVFRDNPMGQTNEQTPVTIVFVD